MLPSGPFSRLMVASFMLVAAAAGRAQSQEHGHDHHHHDGAHRAPEQVARIAQAEASLAGLDVGKALSLYERAADQEHAPDIELGLVRTHMQAGDYRRAAGFAAHTAGAHGEEVGGAALYAWLLHIAGQGAFAQGLLNDADKRVPGSALIAQTRQQLAQPWPTPSGELMQLPWRMAPYAQAGVLPAPAQLVGNGVVVDGGRRVLVPLHTLQGLTEVGVRNGLGLTRKAVLEKRADELGVALLRLQQAFPADQDLAYDLMLAPRDPFPGSPSALVEYAPSADAMPAWPLLRLGLSGRPQSVAGFRELGVDAPAGGPRGGPVFDAAGRFTGLALTHAACPTCQGTGDVQLPLSRLQSAFGDVLGKVQDVPPGQRLPVDELYERSMRITVQVLSLR